MDFLERNAPVSSPAATTAIQTGYLKVSATTANQEARDQPTRVRVRSRKREARLTALRTRPVPRSAMRDSLLEQSRMMTRAMAVQARPEGRPG